MQRPTRPDGLDTTVGALRSPSISSDVMSSSAKSSNNAVPHAIPPPAYIAASGASNLLSMEFDRTVIASPQALNLVNEFLDQVLFNILATARSVSLGALRTAVPSVLKPRLGKAAVRAAEDDLKEYLEDEEEAELAMKKGPIDPKMAFDTELAWKLARLRCMVYAQLGDLEEEEEEEWLEKEQLLQQVETRRDTHGDIELGPASAIFLASVIEYLGEQALFYAAQHAQKRFIMARNQNVSDADDTAATLTPKTDEIVLEGRDMNHVGRDSPLSRLWRSWRRNTRENGSRPMSPDTIMSPGSIYTPSHSRSGSLVPGIQQIAEEQKTETEADKSPSQIPLPLKENDVDEIEVPGLASAISDSEDDDLDIIESRRPASMVIMPGSFPSQVLAETVDDPSTDAPAADFVRPSLGRHRSISSPARTKEHFSLWRPYEQPHILPQDVNEGQEDDNDDNVKELESPNSPQSMHSLQTPTSASSAQRRGRASPREPGSPNKRDGMVGGPLAEAVGALGAGAGVLATVVGKVDGEKPQPTRELDSSSIPAKKTVAEEMMGTGSPVAPPSDASTGASITNVADFDSMYVPMEMEPGSKQDSASAGAVISQPAAIKADEVANTTPQDDVEVYRKPLPTPPTGQGQRKPSVDKPLPILTQPTDLNRAPSAEGVDVATAAAAAAPPHDSPVSPMPLSEYRPTTADSNISAEEDSQKPLRPDALRSNPITHVPAEARSSPHSQHSKSSSSSSRILGFTRDAAGKPQTISQQHATGGMSEYARAAHSSTPTGANHQARPSTASSSTGRLYNKTQGAAHMPKKSEDIDANKKKSLEILIRSNETLHYTLTPANVMKDNENHVTSKKRTETQEMADFFRNTAPPGSESVKINRVPINQAPAGGMGNAYSRTAGVTSPSAGRTIPSSQTPSQYKSSPNRPRNRLGEARDPRAERNTTMRDLADYARSTGPMYESQLPQALSPRPPQTNLFEPSRLATSQNPVPTPPKQSASSKPKNRVKLQARDARPSHTADSADLIDFIREGPPRTAGDHRIDRKVAPFRTTMDSEDLNNLAPNVEASSPPPRPNAGAYDERSANGAVRTQPTRAQPSQEFMDDGMPKRTRRRVKDPYAIDDSDDELYDEDLRGPAPSNEESLIDFLRNTAPPPGMAPQPILTPRAGNSQNQTSTTGNTRDKSPHLTQSGSRVDKYRPTQPTHAPHIERQRVKSHYEAREARPRRTDTSDLADYFRNSGPPPSAEYDPQPLYVAQAQAAQQARDEGGLKRMFTKRKVR